MKIFLDTSNKENILKWLPLGIIDGVTTNPTTLSKEGKEPKKQILEICSAFPHGDISVEVTEQEPEKVYAQAKVIAALAKNITVKIPCQTRYYGIIKKLVEEKIAINITLVFTLIQATMMCKLGVRYISPFIGRWDDIDVQGSEFLYEIRAMIDEYGYTTQILAASLRSPRHLHEAITAGADIATVAPEILEKALNHLLTNQGVEKFLYDWAKADIKRFP
ncbi:MAG: fructose-6-phosphate aldolase [Candidatus Dependentiae bacterium]|nr:fructose-6-phosphate aldolase [Candidatus Dependentiae bacterium]